MRFLVALLLVSAVALAACAQPPAMAVPPPAGATVALAGLKACAVLTGAQLTSLGQATTGRPSGSSGAHCSYPSARHGGPQLTIELVSGNATTGKAPGDQRIAIGRHTAVRTEIAMTGQCDIGVLAGHGVVLVIGTDADGGVGTACTLATAAARLLEPTLP
jgi:hypothetical protein